MTRTAATGLCMLSVVVLWCSLVAAETGYFEIGGSGTECTQSQPCADPFQFFASFDEYVLAPGQYTFSSTVSLSNQTFLLRTWQGKGGSEPVVLTGTGISVCFTIASPWYAATTTTWTFEGVVMECPHGTVFNLAAEIYYPPTLELEDVTFRNAHSALRVYYTAPQETEREQPLIGERDPSTTFRVETTNVVVQGHSCLAGNPPMWLQGVEWTFQDVNFLNNCHGIPYPSSVCTLVLYGTTALGSLGKLLFDNNYSGPTQGTLALEYTSLEVDRTEVQFVNNTSQATLALQGSSWKSTGQISFIQNSVDRLIELNSNSPSLQSLVPIFMKDNQITDSYPFAMFPSTTFCAIPCSNLQAEDCDCNDKPVLQWNFASNHLVLPFDQDSLSLKLTIDPLAFNGSSAQLTFVVELSEGLQLTENFLIEPAWNETTSQLVLAVPENAEEVEIIITRLPALTQEANLFFSIAPDQEFLSSAPSFFISANTFQVAFAGPTPPPSQVVFQPQQSNVSVTFPSQNTPDHTLSVHDPEDNQAFANRSVTAKFGALAEVDEDGQVVATVSLHEIQFVGEELGNTTFNLNHAQPFFSFSAHITSLFSSAGNEEGIMALLNLTEAINVQVNFTMFAEEQLLSFAGVEQVMRNSTLKWSLFLSSWPFQHHNHSLRLHLSILSQDGPVTLKEVADPEDGVRAFSLQTENTEIPVNVLPLALVADGTATASVEAEWLEAEQEVVISLPWFDGSLLLDPDISLLLAEGEEEEEGGGGKDEEDQLWWKITVPLLVVLMVAAVVVVAVLSSLHMRRRSRRHRNAISERLQNKEI
ncbi:hypothetical protein QOT17_013272 [Balamuthia mandrillaris]